MSLDNQVQYSHKKRFNSDKILAASVGIEVNSSLVSFEIESLEVEMNPIQEGVKKWSEEEENPKYLEQTGM